MVWLKPEPPVDEETLEEACVPEPVDETAVLAPPAVPPVLTMLPLLPAGDPCRSHLLLGLYAA